MKKVLETGGPLSFVHEGTSTTLPVSEEVLDALIENYEAFTKQYSKQHSLPERVQKIEGAFQVTHTSGDKATYRETLLAAVHVPLILAEEGSGSQKKFRVLEGDSSGKKLMRKLIQKLIFVSDNVFFNRSGLRNS